MTYMIYNLADLYQGLWSQVDRLVSIKNSWLKLILQFLKERNGQIGWWEEFNCDYKIKCQK